MGAGFHCAHTMRVQHAVKGREIAMRRQRSSCAWSDGHKRNRVLRRGGILVVLTSAGALLPVVVLVAAEAVKIGGMDVPADSPLARKEHPRLLFTNDELPAIRRRAKLPGVQADLKLIEEMSRKDPDRLGATTAAVAWVLTGRRTYRDRAIQLILSEGCGHYVQDSGLYAYDILYDELTAQQRYEGVGRITAYASCPEWTYACGDASRSYSPDRVKSFSRQLLYIRPDTFVIFDRVESASSDLPKRWLLHTMEKPEAVARSVVRQTRPGHFSVTGDTLTAAHMGGRIFCRTLLPAERTIEIIGGSKHRFEVAGVNRDMPQSWYDQVGDRENFRLKNTFGEWRVEVTAKPGSTTDIFLHVLHCADKDETRMIPVEISSTAARRKIVANLIIGEKQWWVELNTADTVGARLRTGEGSWLELPTKVEDNYHRWESDPRYKEWMINNLYRPVIGEAEVDTWRRDHATQR